MIKEKYKQLRLAHLFVGINTIVFTKMLCERQSAKLIMKGTFIENIFLNSTPQERTTSVWRARNE